MCLQASVLHHEAFLHFREEFKHHEAETQELAEKKDTYRLLSDKLHAELETAQKENAGLLEQVIRIFDHSDIFANDPKLQSQKRLYQVGQFRVEVDAMKAEAEEWKKNMDRLASEKEIARAQLASAEFQLWAAKEKISAQAKMIEEL